MRLGDFGEVDPSWGAHDLSVIYEMARNFIKRPLVHTEIFFPSNKASPSGINNTQDEKVKGAFRQIHSYFSSIFNSDEISGYILKKFERLEEFGSSGCYHGHYCSMENRVYSKDVIKRSVFYNLNDMEDEFDMINEANVSSVGSCSSSLYAYASSSSSTSSSFSSSFSFPLKFPFYLLNNALITNSLSEAYKYMLYKTQQNQIFKLYSISKGTNMSLLETVFLQLILNFGMTPYNKLKGTMINSFCRKKGRLKQNGALSNAHAGQFQYRKGSLSRNEHILYVSNGEHLQGGLTISCSLMEHNHEYYTHDKTPTEWWNSYSSSYNNTQNQERNHRVYTWGH